MQIDIAMPTKESADVIGATLDRAATAVQNAGISVNQLVVVDDESADGTLDEAFDRAQRYGWTPAFASQPATLPEARERAIDLVETEWFWFLDDDVRVWEDYVQQQLDAIAPAVGAVQGRKADRTEHPSDWSRRRARRGGTHATLIRHEAVADVEIPDDITVLEDEYLRRQTEANGFKWFFHPHARFDHANQDRHPIGWTEGYVGGKYGLQPFQTVALNVPFAAATGRNPVPHAKRTVGWLAGRTQRATEESPVAPGGNE